MYYSTAIPHIVVDISIRERKDGKIVAKGIPKNRQTDEYIEEIGAVERTADSRKRKSQLIRRTIEEIERRYRQIQPEEAADAEAMREAFAIVKRKVEEGLRLKPGWKNKETNQNELKFFERNILKLLLPFANPEERQYLATDREEIEKTIKEGCQRRSRGKDGGDIEAAYSHLQGADLIYQAMREVNPRLPDIILAPDDALRRTPPEEQTKALTVSTMRQFCAKLKNLISKNPKLVFFAVLMIFGLRPAEGAAIKPCDIVYEGTYCYLCVVAQGKKGIIVNRTKNTDSIRIVVIPYWGMKILEECCRCIGEDYPHDDGIAMNDPEQCAEAIKDLLIRCGASEQIFSNNVLKELDSCDMEPEDSEDPREAKKRIACYVLRRNFASMCRNIMGLTLAETDALMGHVVQGRNGGRERSYSRPDLTIPDTRQRFAERMERYVFDPERSLHPAHTPIALRAGERKELIEFSKYELVARDCSQMEVSFTLEAAECGEDITLIIESESGEQRKLTGCHISSMKKSWEDKNRIVIGDCDRFGKIEWEKR